MSKKKTPGGARPDPAMPSAAGLTPAQVVSAVRRFVGSSTCGEKDLYEELLVEAEGWEMRAQELDDEGEEDQKD